MDHVLAEFAARLPARLKVRGRTLRYAQVELARRYLPPELLNRRKQGFASALPYMLRDELEVLYRAFLGRPHLVREGILRQDAVDRLVAEHREGRADHGHRLWLLLNSEVWYRMLIEEQDHDTIRDRIRGATRGDRVVGALDT
jgi:asparagine synthase (glutamine-hydrolysing)